MRDIPARPHGLLLDNFSTQASSTIPDDFKKFKIETILKILGHIALEHVDVWFQDEARFGQQNTTTRLWAEKGTRPRAVKQQQFEYTYLFGSVCPARGIGEATIVPWVTHAALRDELWCFADREFSFILD